MKACKIFLKIFFSILFVASITLNLIFGFSSTNKLIFGDNLESRISLYHNSKRQLEASNNFTLSFESSSKKDDEVIKKTIETSCETDSENTKKCSEIENHFINYELNKAIYLPGDNKAYFIEGEEKYFKTHGNTEILEIIDEEIYFLTRKLELIYIDTTQWNKEQEELIKDEKLRSKIEINSSVRFDIKNLSLLKEMTLIITKPMIDEENDETINHKQIFKFKFDGSDRLVEYLEEDSSTQESMCYKIKYESTKLNFPDSNEFVEKGGE